MTPLLRDADDALSCALPASPQSATRGDRVTEAIAQNMLIEANDECGRTVSSEEGTGSGPTSAGKADLALETGRTLHTYSYACGIAISRLVDDAPPGLEIEAAAYIGEARDSLCLDNCSLCAGMMFAQPLLKRCSSHWKFAVTVGLIIGTKFTTEGFFTSDVVTHLTKDFSVAALAEWEGIAISDYDFSSMANRLRSFRNSLLLVALEDPLPGLRPSASLTSRVVGLSELPELHVLIVDSSPIVLDFHRGLVHHVRPQARVHAVTRCVHCNAIES